MSTKTLGQLKKEVRAQAWLQLKALPQESFKPKQLALDVHLGEFLKKQKGRWGAYRALPQEASPFSSIQNNQHLQWAYPRVSATHTLEFYLNPEVWVSGAFGIEEPDPEKSELVHPLSLEGCLVPGLGFDQYGTRLGRGQGYFDRALEGFKGLKVGIAWEAQIFSEPLPQETYDVPMDVIITDRGVIKPISHSRS